MRKCIQNCVSEESDLSRSQRDRNLSVRMIKFTQNCVGSNELSRPTRYIYLFSHFLMRKCIQTGVSEESDLSRSQRDRILSVRIIKFTQNCVGE